MDDETDHEAHNAPDDSACDRTYHHPSESQRTRAHARHRSDGTAHPAGRIRPELPIGVREYSRMPIVIHLVGERYTAEVTPPHGSHAWSTSEPMTQDDLIDAMYKLGCHQTDMGDAFYEADPEWLTRGKN